MVKLKFAKCHELAVIPSKRVADAGYDVYTTERNMVILPPHTIHLFKTGIKSAFSSDYVMLGRDRGSTGVKGICYQSMVIDSNYRGEWLVPIRNISNNVVVFLDDETYNNPTEELFEKIESEICKLENKDFLFLDQLVSNLSIDNEGKLTKTGYDTLDNWVVVDDSDDSNVREVIFYPYSKAICQALLVPVPKVEVVEISEEELMAIPSDRGEGKLGSSGK